ncbi:MAG: bifunctional proline dehydrogenase/L-glutamate gamma-semialdehyde dehydrogenase PutA, partial [Psychromonas sp.]|nr:bifunctional proline dehydrogenase/L-glutamate gamma-semialdehyde dehydrogenase PutA [Psychromonas sp.]
MTECIAEDSLQKSSIDRPLDEIRSHNSPLQMVDEHYWLNKRIPGVAPMTEFIAQDALQKSFIDRPLDELWSLISPLHMVDEDYWLKQLIPMAKPSKQENNIIVDHATDLINRVRADKKAVQMLDALLLEYSLDTQEGILLMCLSEALMRIPDKATADALIRDKLSVADWKSHLSKSDSVFVNASTWGLLLTGKVVSLDTKKEASSSKVINRLVTKFTEPVIRQAMNQAMKIMGYQFVLGQGISEAQKNGKKFVNKGYTYSFDMLGESALTTEDAQKYLNDYLSAIEAVGAAKHPGTKNKIVANVSIKLSALHPRYQVANQDRVLSEMYESLIVLVKRARALDVSLTIDAEEADRLELSLVLFEKVYRHEVSRGWGKLGLVVQTYLKSALPVLTWIAGLAKDQGDLIPLRLVKGAYWDAEVKLAQLNGYASYSVYTRKEATDVSYLACARFLLSEQVRGLIYPQFASHNAHTVVAVASMASHKDYEFQRLHGMADALYRHTIDIFDCNVRIYAPVGNYKDLLPYLVRRLLENGANSSFVHRIVDANCPVESLTVHPVETLLSRPTLHNGLIPAPTEIFADRKNSYSINIDIESEAKPFEAAIAEEMKKTWLGGPIVNGTQFYPDSAAAGVLQTITAPYDHNVTVGSVLFSNHQQVEKAIASASSFFKEWSKTDVTERAQYLDLFSDLLEKNMPELIALCHKEAGKTIHDSIDEVREAVDFCRYYAQQARENFAAATTVMSFDEITHQVERQGKGV